MELETNLILQIKKKMIFSVKSACNLGMEVANMTEIDQSSSQN